MRVQQHAGSAESCGPGRFCHHRSDKEGNGPCPPLPPLVRTHTDPQTWRPQKPHKALHSKAQNDKSLQYGSEGLDGKALASSRQSNGDGTCPSVTEGGRAMATSRGDEGGGGDRMGNKIRGRSTGPHYCPSAALWTPPKAHLDAPVNNTPPSHCRHAVPNMKTGTAPTPAGRSRHATVPDYRQRQRPLIPRRS